MFSFPFDIVICLLSGLSNRPEGLRNRAPCRDPSSSLRMWRRGGSSLPTIFENRQSAGVLALDRATSLPSGEAFEVTLASRALGGTRTSQSRARASHGRARASHGRGRARHGRARAKPGRCTGESWPCAAEPGRCTGEPGPCAGAARRPAAEPGRCAGKARRYAAEPGRRAGKVSGREPR